MSKASENNTSSIDLNGSDEFDKLKSYQALMRLDRAKLASFAYRLTKIVDHQIDAIDNIQNNKGNILVKHEDKDNLIKEMKNNVQQILQMLLFLI